MPLPMPKRSPIADDMVRAVRLWWELHKADDNFCPLGDAVFASSQFLQVSPARGRELFLEAMATSRHGIFISTSSLRSLRHRLKARWEEGGELWWVSDGIHWKGYRWLRFD